MMNLDSEKIANPCINRLLLNPKGIFVSHRDALYLLHSVPAWRNDRNQWFYKGEVRKGDAKTTPAETSMDSIAKPNKSKNYPHYTSSLGKHLPDQQGGTRLVPAEKRGIECCASGYPELKSLQ